MIEIFATFTAVKPGMISSFKAGGGTAPYTYSVVPGGAGGSIDSNGLYTAPSLSPSAGAASDTIQVIDSLGELAIKKIVVGGPLWLLCDILQRELGLEDGHVYLWDQKINVPKDEALYIAVAVVSAKPFGVSNSFDPSSDGVEATQSVNMQAKLDINIMSRGPAARDRKEEIILALSSVYAEQQMQGNGFNIARLSSSFVNLSEIDGSAIPYRFVISVNMQYAFQKKKSVDYFDSFGEPEILTEP